MDRQSGRRRPVVKTTISLLRIAPGSTASMSLSFITYRFILFLVSFTLLFSVSTASALPQTHRKLIAAIPPDFPPTYFRDSKTGKPLGYAVDIMKEIANRTGMEVEFVFGEAWDELHQMVLTGKADLIPNLVISPDRQKLFIFTTPVETIPINLIVRSSDTRKTTVISAGSSVGAIAGSSAHSMLAPRTDIKLVQYNNLQQMLFDLLSGKIDVIQTATPNIMKLAVEAGVDDHLKVLEPAIYEGKRGMALRHDDVLLKKELNAAIALFVGTEEYKKIYQKWWGKPKLYWTPRRIATASGVIFGSLLLIFGWWRFATLTRLKNSLRLAQAEQSILLDNIHTQVWYLTDDHTYGAVNKAHADFNGVRIEDFAYKDLYEIFPADVAEICQAANRVVFATGKSVQTEEWLPHVSGERRFVSIYKSPKLRNDGSVEYVVCSAEDITEQKQAEEKLQIFAQQIDEKNSELVDALVIAKDASRAKSEFLAKMSHEIRTPMNAILGFAQVLKRDTGLTDKQMEYLETITRSGGHLLQMISDILDMSRIEAGRLKIEPSDFNLRSMIAYMKELFAQRMKGKGLCFTVEQDPSLPSSVRGDEGKIQQIILNLLSNAFKFTEHGGVTLRVHADHKVCSSGYLLVVEVEDSGPGIEAEQLERIFEEFHQAKLGKKIGGTGLGLAISRRYVDLMGGSLMVSSDVGKGSLFRLEVQLEHSEGSDDHHLPLHRIIGLEEDQKPIRLLVVDDKPDNRRLLCELLEPLGFELLNAENGAEGLKKTEQWQPHAILLNMRIPVMDGYAMVRQIRLNPTCREVFIIAITASAFDDDRQEVFSAGVDEYLRKPFQPNELFGILEKGLGLNYLVAESDDASLCEQGIESAPPRLPTALVASLQEAAEGGDVLQLQMIGDELLQIDANAAEALKRMISRYDYEAIEKWIAKAGGIS